MPRRTTLKPSLAMREASASEKFHGPAGIGVELVGRELVHRVDPVEEHHPPLAVVEERTSRRAQSARDGCGLHVGARQRCPSARRAGSWPRPPRGDGRHQHDAGDQEETAAGRAKRDRRSTADSLASEPPSTGRGLRATTREPAPAGGPGGPPSGHVFESSLDLHVARHAGHRQVDLDPAPAGRRHVVDGDVGAERAHRRHVDEEVDPSRHAHRHVARRPNARTTCPRPATARARCPTHWPLWRRGGARPGARCPRWRAPRPSRRPCRSRRRPTWTRNRPDPSPACSAGRPTPSACGASR